MADQAGWVEAATASTGVATATRTAETGKQHIVFSVDASATPAAQVLLLQIKDGTTVVWEGYVLNQRDVNFPRGLSITRGNACSAVFAAGSSVTKVNLHGITK